MKALPLWQPWATLVAIEAKQVETRGYPPRRLGLNDGQRIAIHATKRDTELWLCEEEPFSEVLGTHGYGLGPENLPLGAIIAVCTIDRATEINELNASQLERLNPNEFAFGNYAPGRWAWVLRDVKELAEPIPFKGSQGTFDVPDEETLEAMVAELQRLGTGP